MRTTIPSYLRLFRQCLLLGFLLAPVMAVGQLEDELLEDFEFALRLAEQGDAGGQFFLGLIYSLGKGVPEDDAEALKWYRLAADQGHAGAQYNLGLMYANG